ncbi:MAG: TIGR00159 family protein [Candidatus Lambdaproteobacteria bacterium]|nr:TIGR00159 family protein [Candidatus Lambdaproteobacteria bacterium]
MTRLYELVTNLRLRDVIDIALLSAIIYGLLLLIKGTRTIPILLGLTVLVVAYGLASFLNLDAISFLMSNLFSSAVVILVVLFQADIRNALAQVGMTTMLRELSATPPVDLIDEVATAAYDMAQKRIGASIVLELETGLRNYTERGKAIMARPTADLLVSIFVTASPLHDGAVIINRKGQLAAARCILPLSMNPATSAFLGTRHRSALGLSEETDAVIVVVSEERGVVSLAHGGTLLRDIDEPELRSRLTHYLQGADLNDSRAERARKAEMA